MRNKSDVVIERHVPLPPEPVEHGQEAKMFFVDASSDEFDNRDVIPWLAPGAEPVAEYEAQGSLQCRFPDFQWFNFNGAVARYKRRKASPRGRMSDRQLCCW